VVGASRFERPHQQIPEVDNAAIIVLLREIALGVSVLLVDIVDQVWRSVLHLGLVPLRKAWPKNRPDILMGTFISEKYAITSTLL
jgi:hypothetical protein